MVKIVICGGLILSYRYYIHNPHRHEWVPKEEMVKQQFNIGTLTDVLFAPYKVTICYNL